MDEMTVEEKADATKEFIEAFNEECSYNDCGICKLVADGILPLGVDHENEQVKEIIVKCRNTINSK
jgi:hypothetical protein